MKHRGLNTINASFFILFAVGNLISCITFNDPLWKILIYTLPLIGISVSIYILKKRITYKFTAWLFLGFSLLSVVMGDHGNMTGAIFICFAFYLFQNDRIVIVAAISTALTILGKSVITPFTIPQTINFIGGYFYIIAIYWVLIHPKPLKKISDEIDYETAEVIKMVISGLTYKEIADRLTISTSAVSKKLERCRSRFNAKSNEHLVALLVKKGHIVL